MKILQNSIVVPVNRTIYYFILFTLTTTRFGNSTIFR